MTARSPLSDIEATVQELRLEQDQSTFTQKLAHVVSAIGAIPDSPPQGFTADTMLRLRQLADATVEAIEQRIDSGGDGEKVQQKLAGTVYRGPQADGSRRSLVQALLPFSASDLIPNP